MLRHFLSALFRSFAFYNLTRTYDCAYIWGAMFEWDKSKAKKNLLKHGIAFADSFAVFEDPNAVTLADHGADEQRYVTIGMDALGRLLVVAYTWRGDNIRIISARKAVRSEVKQYESEI
jgi:uncharacterized protein